MRINNISTTDNRYISGRYSNYDLMRIICTIAVIMIHVSQSWVDGISTAIEGGSKFDFHYILCIALLNSICRFAVPCFIMLSGAFLLENNKNSEYSFFYKKIIIRIGIPLMCFSIFYILYKLVFVFIGEGSTSEEIIQIFISVLRGAPMAHLWYLYMMIGIYIMTPIIFRFRNSISEKIYNIIAITFFVVSIISRWTTKNTFLYWDVGQSFEYMSFYMLGSVIRRNIRMNHSNCKAFLFICSGLVMECIASFFIIRMMSDGLYESDLTLQITQPYTPWIAVASVLIFIGFSNLKINANLYGLASESFYIYLIHMGVWDFITRYIKIRHINLYQFDGRIFIPICITCVFLFSWMGGKAYTWLMIHSGTQNRIESRANKLFYKVRERIR